MPNNNETSLQFRQKGILKVEKNGILNGTMAPTDVASDTRCTYCTYYLFNYNSLNPLRTVPFLGTTYGRMFEWIAPKNQNGTAV